VPIADKTIQKLLYTKATAAIRNIDATIAADVYALAMEIISSAVPREFHVNIAYNTLTHFESAKTRADDEYEAKWRILYWQCDDKPVLDCNDPKIEEWLQSLGYDYNNHEVYEDFQKHSGYSKYHDLSEKFGKKYTKIIISICRQLHTDGVIEQKFGRVLPILICDSILSCGPLEWTQQGNPVGQAAEFERWMLRPPKTETPEELHERLKEAMDINWEQKNWDEMSPVEFYKDFIDELVFGYTSTSVSAKRLVERNEFPPQMTGSGEWHRLLSGLTEEQIDLLALKLLEERQGAIHDVLAQLTYRVDSGMEIMFNGKPVPTQLSGMGLHGDYIGRLDENDRWEWPET